jgi:citrate lyase subunit beta/citryl-CoA lyase
VVCVELAAVLLAHTTEPQDVRDLAVALREFENARGIEPGDVRAFPVIDTARGLLRAPEIAAAVPRVAGLVLDAAAYARDVGGREEEGGPRLAYARGAVVAAARAHDGLPLVVAGPHAFREASQAGFAGAVVAGPADLAAAHLAFTPTDAAGERAAAHIDAYEAARNLGDWVARVGTEVVDAHAMRKARRTLEQGE